MFKRFRLGSIRRQIAALAVGPVICLTILGALAEEMLLDDYPSVSYARMTALKIEMVIDQVRASTSKEQEAAILDAVSRTGLQVEEVPETELVRKSEARIPPEDIRRLIRNNLSLSWVTAFRADTVAGKLRDVLVINLGTRDTGARDVGEARALAFLPSPAPADTWINDQQVSATLQVMAIVLPVALLSLYAASMITAPILSFARAAETLKPDEGSDRPFDERGASEIKTLAKSLNDMRSRIRSMMDDRTRMLRAISHDLRTPLTRLRLRAERSTQPELRAALLKDISALSDMIGDTLIYLSKEMVTEKPVNADLPSLLATVCTDFSDMGFAVTYSGPERFAYVCKPRSLARAVTNLVENSTRFAEKISVELALLDDGKVRISVVDDGPGLPGNLRARVLEPFFKVDSARTSPGRSGFGLGLSIVDDIVRAHGGTIELVNGKPHGLTARMDFPAQGHGQGAAGVDGKGDIVRAG